MIVFGVADPTPEGIVAHRDGITYLIGWHVVTRFAGGYRTGVRFNSRDEAAREIKRLIEEGTVIDESKNYQYIYHSGLYFPVVKNSATEYMVCTVQNSDMSLYNKDTNKRLN